MTHLFTAAALIALLVSNAALGKDSPQRVVSLDYCADQFVLKLLPRSRILAVSPDADKHFSYMRDSADGIEKVRPLAEDVLTLEPDLIVRSYGGGPNAARFFEQAGIEVLQIPYANDLDGIRSVVQFLAEGLGVPHQGAELVAEMNRRLERIVESGENESALYMTPTGATSGSGTLVHEMLQAAGFDNFERQIGWRSIPLERLAYEQPDIVAAAFFIAGSVNPSHWSPMRHPIAKKQMHDQPTVMLQGAWTSCSGWYLLDAIEALAETRSTSTAK
jgi:iron complex transport system substrate-binding protein